MTRIALDTSAYSAFMRGNEGVAAALRQAEEIVLSPVVLGELRAGFRGGTRRSKNESELAEFVASPRVRLAIIDADTADRYAEIVTYLRQAGTPIPTNDVWIAANAMEHGLQVVTTDPRYQKIAQVLVNLHE
jgi:tRNA(fMet)-specific endonuclease VapC